MTYFLTILIDKQRKAARKAKAKEDPYYLYDEKAEAMGEVEDIPIVRLDDAELDDNREYHKLALHSINPCCYSRQQSHTAKEWQDKKPTRTR